MFHIYDLTISFTATFKPHDWRLLINSPKTSLKKDVFMQAGNTLPSFSGGYAVHMT